MTRVLVTGGAGYVGSHAAKALAGAGYEPVVYDNLSTGRRHAVKWGPLVIGDIADGDRVAETVRAHGVSAALHFAALCYVEDSTKAPLDYYRTNVAGSLALIEALRASSVRRLVFSSTCATYGVPDEVPISETAPQNPISPYGRSKLMVELMLRDLARVEPFAFAALRYFNACGCDPDGELGEEHDPETHLVPRALMAVAGALPHLEVFGVDYPTPDGTAVRDFVHVSDLARAHVDALRWLENGGGNLELNLGSGEGRSVKEVVAAVERVTGRPLPVVWRERRAGDPPELRASRARAAETIGFEPRHSDLDTIVETAWRFFSTQGAQPRRAVEGWRVG